MATAPKPACKRVLWRGVVVCSHTVPKLDAWAKAVGAGILLKPLPGCGSYQTSTAASAGTHAGGGAIDIDLRAVPSSQRKWVADKGRTSGLQVAWNRDAIAGLWTWHAHALDPDCPQLAKVAAAQCVEMFNGGDGLVGTRPDGNTRTNVAQLKGIFNVRAVVQVADTVSSIGQSVADAARVKAIQKALHITADGVWGKQTDSALYWLWNIRKGGLAQFKRYNVVNRKVMQTQWGARYVDGIWGPVTQAANVATVRLVQKALGVTVDGVWGPVTARAYYALRGRVFK